MVPCLALALLVAVASETSASQSAPAAPGPVPPNASRITATVRAYDQTLHSLTIEVETSAPDAADTKSYAVPKQVIEVFSKDAVPPDVVGQRIEGRLTLTGDTRGVRWWISNVRKQSSP